jgi:hypothetical protein
MYGFYRNLARSTRRVATFEYTWSAQGSTQDLFNRVCHKQQSRTQYQFDKPARLKPVCPHAPIVPNGGVAVEMQMANETPRLSLTEVGRDATNAANRLVRDG